jgi:hypothetical protein
MGRMADAGELHTDNRGRYWIPAELGHLGLAWDTPKSTVSAASDISGTPGTPGTPTAPEVDSQPSPTRSSPLEPLSQVSQKASDQQKQAALDLSQGCPSLSQKEPDERKCLRCGQESGSPLVAGRCRERCAYPTERDEDSA